MDVKINMTGDGGELVMQQCIIESVTGYENMPMLAMFGGSDFWGNYLFEGIQDGAINSKTELALKNNPLTPSGLTAIQAAITEDLQFIEDNIPGTKVSSQLALATNPRRLDILITIDGKTFAYSFNPDTQQITYQI
jgi:hypothetical protein